MKSVESALFHLVKFPERWSIPTLDIDRFHRQNKRADLRSEDIHGFIPASHTTYDSIDRQIMSCLQGNESDKSKDGLNYPRFVEQEAVSRLKTDIAGNDKCVDCGTPGPSWASLNLGVLMCIECSGIHRNLGSHVSRVRSLDLDSWLPEHLAVMISLGNQRANLIWEVKTHPGVMKPGPASSQEVKEKYIRAKYEHKMLVSDLPTGLPPAQ